MYIIIDLKANRYKQSSLGNTIQSILTYTRSEFYGYLKYKKNSLTEQIQKKLSEESVKAIKK